jgi:D-alanine transaminase
MVLVTINGSPDHQFISVLDRGVMFGESVYEVIPLHFGQLFEYKKHISRLKSSFEQVCQQPFPQQQVVQWISEYVLMINPHSSYGIYVQLTSGSTPIRNHLQNDQSPSPTCIIHQTDAEAVSPEEYARGFRAIALEDQRSKMSNLKTVQLAFNTFALNKAHQLGYDDAVFTRNGFLVEAASSNVFAVIDQKLVTPPLEGIVPGITRDVILRIAKQNNIPFAIRPIAIHELEHANEVFLSSSIKLLKPLNEIRGLYHNPGPFPHWQRLFSLFQQYIHKSCTHVEPTY